MVLERKKDMRKKVLFEIGWREEVSIPELSRYKIKAKVDTGARTSALHVTGLKITKKGKYEYASFVIHPKQDSSQPAIKCEKRILEKRNIKSSSGHISLRPVIEVEIKMGEHIFKTEITLVNRDLMGFRMLLGRKTLKGMFVVNVARSFMLSPKKE